MAQSQLRGEEEVIPQQQASCQASWPWPGVTSALTAEGILRTVTEETHSLALMVVRIFLELKEKESAAVLKMETT